MKFDWFVMPFIAGLLFVFGYIFYSFYKWIKALTKEDKQRLNAYFFSRKIISSIREIFNESLLHRKIFKSNPLLGYMHMSLAFGWLLLIVVGNIEIKFYSEYSLNPPYVPIFLRFFEPAPAPHFFAHGFNFLMDLILLMVLSGVFLAFYKRYKSRSFGLNNTVTHTPFDRLALGALWFIFPLRLLAESFSSGINHTGSFLTGNLGDLFSLFLPLESIYYPAWLSYSAALGLFFFALPFSRYMHIPAEVLLIVFRNAGIKAEVHINSLSKVEIHSCSRCGICIDACQMATSLAIKNIQPASFIRDVRYQKLKTETSFNCLMCGRCNLACPVGIQSTLIRQSKRIENQNIVNFNFSYIQYDKPKSTDVLYFAGCMTHLTPTISRSVGKIFNDAGVNWEFLDKDGSICCGRPLKLAGQLDAAKTLIEKNKKLIIDSGAKILVTSCPICYHAFKSDYNLDIEVLHHSQYLLQLIENDKIRVDKSGLSAIYHDPCELGRNSNVFLQPRLVVNHAATIISEVENSEKALCCGSSLGNHLLNNASRLKIASDALDSMGIQQADVLVTACPLCKKAFRQATEKPILDIAELVEKQLVTQKYEMAIEARQPMPAAKLEIQKN